MGISIPTSVPMIITKENKKISKKSLANGNIKKRTIPERPPITPNAISMKINLAVRLPLTLLLMNDPRPIANMNSPITKEK
jgi:hypothetical protein